MKVTDPSYQRAYEDGIAAAAASVMAAIEGRDIGAYILDVPALERVLQLVAGMREAIETLTADLDGVSSSPCARCGGPAPEFTVPNDAWNTIIRDDGPELPDEYICLACFATLAAKRIRQYKLVDKGYEALRRRLLEMREKGKGHA